MLSRFLITLFSSWLVNPLGILVAQWFGVANSSIVILVLLATGACVPFQLLMNECVAASVSRGHNRIGHGQLALILAIQTFTCTATIGKLSEHQFLTWQLAIVAFLLIINTTISYLVSLRYYRLVSAAAVSIRAAMFIGVIPGIVSLLLYVAYCLTSQHWPLIMSVFIYGATVVPTLIQWFYLREFFSIANAPHSSSANTGAMLATNWLIAATAALALLAAGSTRLRDIVAHFSVDHVALLLVALNSLLSLINTSTRASFLTRSSGGQPRILASIATAMICAAAGSSLLGWWTTPLLGLIAVQASIAWIIEAARRIPTARPTSLHAP